MLRAITAVTLFCIIYTIKCNEAPIWSPVVVVDTASHVPGEPLSPADYQNAGLLNSSSEQTIHEDDPIELAGLFEGDIILGQGHGSSYVVHYDTNSNNGTATTMHGMKYNEYFVRNAINKEVQKWVGGIIPYVISAQFNALERSVIARAILNYQSSTCIKFRPRGAEVDYINIIKGKGCSSHVGRTGGAQPVILGEGCVFTGIATHELMHAIGFWHEQSRYDRDDHVIVYFDNIATGMDFNFKKYSWRDTQNLSAPYDTGSILHYGPYAFSKDKKKPTILPRKANPKMGQREALTQIDLLKINRLYNCNGVIPSTPAATEPNQANSSPTGQLKCVDSHTNCGKWAQRGECSKSSSQWMIVNCRKSCNRCNSPCADSNEYCPQWANAGECTKNPDYMSVYCPQSCGTCPQESASTAGSAVDNVVTECTDRNEYCKVWADRGECQMNPQYMLTYCQKSCSVCVVASNSSL